MIACPFALQPAVCARELCVFSFQTLGVMSDAAEDIATGAEVCGWFVSSSAPGRLV